jgi:hypothetical protein
LTDFVLSRPPAPSKQNVASSYLVSRSHAQRDGLPADRNVTSVASIGRDGPGRAWLISPASQSGYLDQVAAGVVDDGHGTCRPDNSTFVLKM